jgi:acetyl esterase/lipase
LLPRAWRHDLRRQRIVREDAGMPYVYLGVTLIGALAVLLAYRPVRKEPFTVLSFVCGWLCAEVSLQNIAWQAVATVLFGVYGAFSNWAGWLGLAVAAVSWAGLIGLARSGRHAADVVRAALDEVRSDAFPVPTGHVKPTWGRWWRVTQAIPLKGRSVSRITNIDYWGDGIARHRLDIYRSRLAPPQGAPVMLYVHGGAWVIGNKREQGKPMMYELVNRGWVCVTINYRLSPKSDWPNHIIDVKRAIAWVKEHVAEYGGDPTFVAISGGSAGGHLSALAALTPGDATWQPGFEDADTSVHAAVPFYGVMDMTGSPEGSGLYGPGLLELLEKRVMKTTFAEHPEVFHAASPTERVNADAPPFFVLQGSNDTLVPVEVARTFVQGLRHVSRQPVAYAELPRAQHAFDVLASLRCQATTAGVAAFLDGARLASGHGATGTTSDAPSAAAF